MRVSWRRWQDYLVFTPHRQIRRRLLLRACYAYGGFPPPHTVYELNDDARDTIFVSEELNRAL